MEKLFSFYTETDFFQILLTVAASLVAQAYELSAGHLVGQALN